MMWQTPAQTLAHTPAQTRRTPAAARQNGTLPDGTPVRDKVGPRGRLGCSMVLYGNDRTGWSLYLFGGRAPWAGRPREMLQGFIYIFASFNSPELS